MAENTKLNDQWVLGLSFGHNSSISLVKNRKLIAHIDSERLSRKKADRNVTKKAIKYVLDSANIKLENIAYCTICNWYSDRGLDGAELFDKSKEGFNLSYENGTSLSQEEYIRLHNSGTVSNGVFYLHIGNQKIPVFICDHHFSHCCSAFYLSPYEDAICVSVDFSDNTGTNHSVYYMNDKEKIFRPLRRGGDFGIGSFYGCIVDFLGFAPSLIGAGKVMALAAYGEQLLADKVDHELIENLSWPDVVKMGDIFHGDQYLHLLTRLGVKNIPDRRNLLL